MNKILVQERLIQVLSYEVREFWCQRFEFSTPSLWGKVENIRFFWWKSRKFKIKNICLPFQYVLDKLIL